MRKNATLISTVGEKCKVCYTCVRDCPAKAIRISNGQAEVISDRCIGCGNCVRVCSQNAKQVYDSIPKVKAVLAQPGVKTAAIIAPSFPAEFLGNSWQRLTWMIRQLGFDLVCEVSFGADIVASSYRKLVETSEKRFIATTCPAIVSYVEKYHPKLIKFLAPVASPMIATARALRILHGDDLKIVFIGPCLAKKVEASAVEKNGEREVEAVLTFVELRKFLGEKNLKFDGEEKSSFDPPHPGLGALFPISGGMLQAADMKEDLLESDIVTAEGKREFVQAIKEFEEGAFDAKLLEILCCDGCIMGSGMSTERPYFSRRSAVSRYVRQRIKESDEEEREKALNKISSEIDMKVEFISDDHRLPMPSREELDSILRKMGKFKPEDELDCGACGYHTCREHAIAIHKGMAESEMCLPNTIERLKQSLDELSLSNTQLERTKQALFSAEKLASMGQLSAGIAHEINNPLGVILLNASILLDETDKDSEIREDLEMIVDQAERCKKIVSGLLNFARKNKVILQSTDIQQLIDQCLKAIVIPQNVEVRFDFQAANPVAEVDADQIIQVMTNLVVNAAEAMPGGGEIDISVRDDDENIKIIVKDNGTGIAAAHLNKIFEPLFTTKQMGKGTGLGLAVTYGIIKMHRGQIDVSTNTDPATGPTGTSFTVTLPKKGFEVTAM